MPAEGLGQPQACVDPADLRHLVARVAHQPGPCVVDAHAFQLRKHAQQVAPQQSLHRRRRAVEHRNSTAPQQPPVRHGPVVVEGEPRVVDRRARAQNLVHPRAERLGHHHVGGDRQHARVHVSPQPRQVTATGQHQVPAAQRAAGRAHAPAGAVALDGGGGAAFVQRRAARFRQRRQAAGVLERVEMQGVGLEQRAMVAIAAHEFPQFARRHGPPLDAVGLRHQAPATLEHARIAEPVGPQHARVGVVAVDAIARDASADQVHCILRAGVEGAGALHAQPVQQCLFTGRESAEDEAAVASGGAMAERLGLQQADRVPASLDQAQRGVEAGEAAADDAGLDLRRARQGGARRNRSRRCAVVAGVAGGHGFFPSWR